jgi:hypothetical protein
MNSVMDNSFTHSMHPAGSAAGSMRAHVLRERGHAQALCPQVFRGIPFERPCPVHGGPCGVVAAQHHVCCQLVFRSGGQEVCGFVGQDDICCL